MSKNRISSIVGIIVGLAFLYASIREADFEAIWGSLTNADLKMIPVVVAALAVFYWLKALRWRHILLPIGDFSSASLVPSMVAGAACNNLLPAHLGEIVRVYLLGREFQLSKSSVLATLIVERIFDILAVLCLLTIALFFLELHPRYYTAAFFLSVTAGISFAVTFFIARYPKMSTDLLTRLLRLLPKGTTSRLTLLFSQLSKGLMALRDAKLFMLILCSSLLQWVAMAMCIYSALIALDIWLPPYASILVLALLVAGLSLPTSPGFVGTIQFCFILGLEQFGVGANVAFSASVFYHIILFVTVTSTGVYFLHRYRLRLRSVYSNEIQ